MDGDDDLLCDVQNYEAEGGERGERGQKQTFEMTDTILGRLTWHSGSDSNPIRFSDGWQ